MHGGIEGAERRRAEVQQKTWETSATHETWETTATHTVYWLRWSNWQGGGGLLRIVANSCGCQVLSGNSFVDEFSFHGE